MQHADIGCPILELGRRRQLESGQKLRIAKRCGLMQLAHVRFSKSGFCEFPEAPAVDRNPSEIERHGVSEHGQNILAQ